MLLATQPVIAFSPIQLILLDPGPQRLLSHPERRRHIAELPARTDHLDSLATELLRIRRAGHRHAGHHPFAARSTKALRCPENRGNSKVTIVVDFVHVLGYLWNAAGCLYPNDDQAAAQWVHRQATRVLEGRARKVAGAIRRQATNARLDPARRKPADEAAVYLTNKAPYLDYPTALTQGWPIATGIIEGACRHLVKDRMDITGARWGLAGAEAILKLRAIIANRDFEEYWKYHLAQERHHVHQARYRNHIIPQAK